jgi:hypothetical protein
VENEADVEEVSAVGSKQIPLTENGPYLLSSLEWFPNRNTQVIVRKTFGLLTMTLFSGSLAPSVVSWIAMVSWTTATLRIQTRLTPRSRPPKNNPAKHVHPAQIHKHQTPIRPKPAPKSTKSTQDRAHEATSRSQESRRRRSTTFIILTLLELRKGGIKMGIFSRTQNLEHSFLSPNS